MFEIKFWDAENLWTDIGTVDGCEAAYEAFERACALAEMLGKECTLIDGETGEVLATFKLGYSGGWAELGRAARAFSSD